MTSPSDSLTLTASRPGVIQDSEGTTEGENTEDDVDELEEVEEEGVHTSQPFRQSNGPQQRAPDSLPALPPLPDEPWAAFNWLSASWKRELVSFSD